VRPSGKIRVWYFGDSAGDRIPDRYLAGNIGNMLPTATLFLPEFDVKNKTEK